MENLMEKIGIQKFNVVGTSYGGFVAYHMAKMWPRKVEKVVIASSGINMRKCDSESLLQRSNCECIEKVMLPSTATELRTLMGLASSSRLVRVFPDALWNDVISVSNLSIFFFMFFYFWFCVENKNDKKMKNNYEFFLWYNICRIYIRRIERRK